MREIVELSILEAKLKKGEHIKSVKIPPKDLISALEKMAVSSEEINGFLIRIRENQKPRSHGVTRYPR